MMMSYYQDTLYSVNRYKKAEKRSRKDKNGKNRQKYGQNGLF